MKNVIKSIGNYSLFAAAFTLAAMLLLTVLDVYLSYAFLLYIPGVFGLTKIMLSVIIFFAAVFLVCKWLLDLWKEKQGGANS